MERCLTLAKAMRQKQDARIYFVTDADNLNLPDEGFTIFPLSENSCCEKIRDVFQRIRPDIIIYDILNISEEYIRQTAVPGAMVVVFDYFLRSQKLSSADLVFNFHPSEGMEHFIDAKFFQGIEYAMLRDEFYRYPGCAKEKNDQCDVLLSFGSTDPLGITKKVLRILSEYSRTRLLLHVVLGQHFREIEDICSLVGKSGNSVELHKKVINMAELMSRMDIAIVSGGLTLFEAMQMRIPSVVVCAHEYAFELADFLDKSSCVLNLGYHDKVTKEMLSEAMDKLLSRDNLSLMRSRLSALRINGAQRISAILLKEISDRVSIFKGR